MISSGQMSDGSHFRRTARQPIELSVRFRRDAEDAPLERDGRLADLGLGGAQIRAGHPPPVGAHLRIVLSAPSAWDPLDLPAEVRWVDGTAGDGPVFGVAFAGLSEVQAEALYQLLSVSRFAEPRA
jgi:hypothetical protein